jgi:hypothetical protein
LAFAVFADDAKMASSSFVSERTSIRRLAGRTRGEKSAALDQFKPVRRFVEFLLARFDLADEFRG